jgi:hypothetical protein
VSGPSNRGSQVRAFAAKAREYLAVAEDCLAQGRLTASAGNAIHAGISAKDVIVVALTGETIKSRDHRQSVKDLRQALGSDPAGAECERALRELIGAKSDVEYGAFMVTEAKAKALLRRATLLVERADRLAVSPGHC